MKTSFTIKLRKFVSDQDGQIIPWTLLSMTMMFGIAATTIDVGNAISAQRQLQAATDAAALAGAASLPDSSATSTATTYANYTSTASHYTKLSNAAMASGYPVLKCLNTLQSWGLQCNGSAAANAIQVKQTASVKTYFGWIFGVKSLNISASATAARSKPKSYNIAIIVDTTLSMGAPDSNCGGISQMNCALNGVQQLLQALSPSTNRVSLFAFPNVTNGTVSIDSSCTTTIYGPGGWNQASYPYDNSDGYYTMLLEGGWAGAGPNRWQSYTQTPWSGTATAMPYTFPPANASAYTPPSGTYGPTYQIVGFSQDYKATDTASTLNSTSALAMASGGVSGCGGLSMPNFDGDYGTYYAGVLYAAQSALTAEQAANANSQNLLVILGDGNSTALGDTNNQVDYLSPGIPTTTAEATHSVNSSNQLVSGLFTLPSGYGLGNGSGSYPSYVGECGQSVVAANYLHSQGTQVYAVAYGAANSSTSGMNGNCSTDVGAGAYPGITPCTTMQDIATDAAHFYSDYFVPGGDSGCQASGRNNTITSLNQIFTDIAGKVKDARLVPDNMN